MEITIINDKDEEGGREISARLLPIGNIFIDRILLGVDELDVTK